MSVEPIGVLTFLIGIWCALHRINATFSVLILSTLLGAAAAVLLGGATIQPSHLLLAFAAMQFFSNERRSARAVAALVFPKPGFWLMCVVAYGALCGYFAPRLMAGWTSIIPLGTSEYASTGSPVPLGPVSSNFTQAIYLSGDLVCFIMTVVLAQREAGFSAITKAVLLAAAGNIVFAVVDLITFSSGTQWALEFIRNAQYAFHNEEEVLGLKRIVGSFTEASSFASYTMTGLGFAGTLWIYGYRVAITGPIALGSGVLLVLSTSSAGLAITPIVFLLLYSTVAYRGGFDLRRNPYRSLVLVCIPFAILFVCLAISLNDAASAAVEGYLDTVIFAKPASSSGVERAYWNSQAVQNLLDTYGLGVGLGTVRTSGLLFALLSNLGVFGSALYGLFFITSLFNSRGMDTESRAVNVAARNACLVSFAGACLGGPTVDQGLIFYVLAGLAVTVPERSEVRDVRGIASFG